ncbi:MAG: hypothetical protein FWG97_02095 [Deltaproteobacteria bacterium]|nr:hypothetical protein [Deltaproteobacteria bacterium]
MNKTRNDSDLVRLSADLDEELTAIFDQVEAALGPEEPQWPEGRGSAPQEEDLEVEAAALPGNLEDMDIGAEGPARFYDPAEDEADWLPPGLLGEPEMPALLSPEAVRELSRIIEEAVERGVAAALARQPWRRP